MEDDLIQRQAQVFGALAHATRLQIVSWLAKQPYTVSQLADLIGKKQANISQHLQVLRRLKIVSSIRRGRFMHYQLTRPSFYRVITLLQKHTFSV